MQTDDLDGSPTWPVRALAPLMALALLVTGAFGSGAYWDRQKSQGDPAHARALVPDSAEPIGRQAMFRIYEDAAATMELLDRQSKQLGWRGKSATTYLDNLRDQLK